MLLEKSGYQVLEATGGREGLKLFLSHRERCCTRGR